MPENIPELPAKFETQLGDAVGAFEILTQVSFSFRGKAPIDVGAASFGPTWGGPGSAPSNDPNSDAVLAKAIEAVLYDRCYSHRLGEPRARRENSIAEDPAFARRLAAANASESAGIPVGQFFSWASMAKSLFARETASVRRSPGHSYPRRFLAMRRRLAPRSVCARRARRPARNRDTISPLARRWMNWQISSTSSASISIAMRKVHPPSLGTVTSLLNRFQVPFQAKAPLSPSLYDRTDAIVLYVGVRYFVIAARIVDAARKAARLTPSVPLFTKRLWPGIGVAIEPGTGESFGSHRCRLVAEGIVETWRAGKKGVSARMAAVAARFSSAGLDLARPYLGPGWLDVFLPPAPAHLP